MKKFLKRVLNRIKRKEGTLSFAQTGEDLIVDLIFRILKIENPTYLDIGAHHPTYLSNTYLFYIRGCKGVCIEPDPLLCEEIHQRRKRDTCLNVGVGASDEEKIPFYVMSANVLSTFSKTDAERIQSYGQQKIERILYINCVSINSILRQYFSKPIDFVSLDIEGKDLEILKTFDFSIQRPIVFCLETLTYVEDDSAQKITSIIDYMITQDYIVFADTYINTIFVDKNTWEQR